MTEDYEITFATLRGWAERNSWTAEAENVTGAARGYGRAARDVLAILDMHGKPAHEPVIFGE